MDLVGSDRHGVCGIIIDVRWARILEFKSVWGARRDLELSDRERTSDITGSASRPVTPG